MHGTKTSNLGVMESDLLIAVGVRFSDRVVEMQKHLPKMPKSSISILTLQKSQKTLRLTAVLSAMPSCAQKVKRPS